MVYMVKQKLEYKGKVFLPGSLIKVDEKDIAELKDKLTTAKKFTKVVENRVTKWQA